MRDDIHFFVQPAPWMFGCELFIQHCGAWVQRVECVQISEGEIPPAAFQLTDAQAQDLIDKLWKAGYRPTEGSGSAGALAATERHLADMRRLVFASSVCDTTTLSL